MIFRKIWQGGVNVFLVFQVNYTYEKYVGSEGGPEHYIQMVGEVIVTCKVGTASKGADF